MNTINFDSGRCKMIAHRGASGLERENTCAAFVVAGVKSYFGIETDVHVTADGRYILSHDSNLERVSGIDIQIEKSPFDLLRGVPLLDTDGKSNRSDLFPPPLEDYVQICHKYGKMAVLELKDLVEEKHIDGIVETIRDLDHLDQTIFTSFVSDNLICLRRMLPKQDIQLLVGEEIVPDTLKLLEKYRFGLDARWNKLDKDIVDKVHALGLPVNCWTVDKPEDAEKLVALGVDYMTSNILE